MTTALLGESRSCSQATSRAESYSDISLVEKTKSLDLLTNSDIVELQASLGQSTLKASFNQLPTSEDFFHSTEESLIELELDDVVSASALRAADRNSKIHKKLQKK